MNPNNSFYPSVCEVAVVSRCTSQLFDFDAAESVREMAAADSEGIYEGKELGDRAKQ
jgi:hypothetical protein